MKICHITSVHARYDVRIFEKECTSLAQAGYEVYLVVNDEGADEIINGVHILSTGHKPSGRRERIIKSIKWVLNKALETDADVYHLHDPELLQIVSRLKHTGKKVVFDAHEDTETQILDKTWIPLFFRIPVAKLYGAYSKNKMKMLSGVISVTPNFVEKYKKTNANTIMVTNYPILNKTDSGTTYSSLDLGEYVFFAGGISNQWCHETIAGAINKLSGIKYLFAGKGSTEYITKICSMSNNIEYLGMISHENVIKYYKGACAGMAILECSQVGDEGTLGNTKLFEIMQAGIPVICSNLKLWKEIVEGYKCGICVKINDINEIAEAIQYVRFHQDESKIMGENGIRAVKEKYNWNPQAKKLINFYEKLLSE